jgi:DNA-binding transcriptional MerR regulator
LSRVNRLTALKELGFSLDQVGPILQAEIGPAELRAMLTLRQAQVSEQIATDRARLAEIERRDRSIESEGPMSEIEFVEKALPAMRLAQLVTTVTAQEEIGPRIGPMFDRLAAALAAEGVGIGGASLAWYESADDGMRIAAGFPIVAASVGSAPDVEIADLEPAPRAITMIHHGGVQTLGDAWQARGCGNS